MRLSPMEADNSPEFTRQSIENCLNLIGDKGKIDMWEMARRTTQTEYVQSLRVIDEYVKQGKIGGVTLSEVNAKSIRQAAKVVKVVGVEIELSLFHTEPFYNGICEACAELGIPVFAYSPLGVSASPIPACPLTIGHVNTPCVIARISHRQGPKARRPLRILQANAALPGRTL